MTHHQRNHGISSQLIIALAKITIMAKISMSENEMKVINNEENKWHGVMKYDNLAHASK